MNNLPDLNEYCESLLRVQHSGKNLLFLLSNLSASGVMTKENEIALYLDIITGIAGEGDLVLLKSHPRSAPEVLRSVVEELSGRYHTVVIDDAKLARLPIELWGSLIQHCAIIPMFSSSAINLKYLYDKEVLFPLNDTLINKYFYRDKVQYVTKAHDVMFESVAGLETWDARSALWRGTP